MSAEGFKFTPGTQPSFPRLTLRADATTEASATWDFTPPPDDRTYCVHFHCRQSKDGVLYVSMFPDTFSPVD